MSFFVQTDWPAIARDYGVVGVACVALAVFVKALLGHVKQQQREHIDTLKAAEMDAREERNYARGQREREANAFIAALKEQNETMKEGFEEVLHEIRNNRRVK